MNCKPRFPFRPIAFSALVVLVSGAISAGPRGPRAFRGSVVTTADNHSKTSLVPQASENLFIEAPEYPTDGGSIFVATGDFNADGVPDLVTANDGGNTNANTVSVLLGNGDGTFQAPIVSTTGTNPTGIVVGDFNGDGIADVATVDNTQESQCANNGAVSVLLGNGDGTFHPHVEYCVGFAPDSITAADFNKDGKLDLAVADGGGSEMSVLLGNGDGTFQQQTTYATGMGPGAITSGDFNNDGNVDLALMDDCSTGTCVTVFLGKGDGTFQTAINSNAPFSGVLAAGDLNHDGNLDLVAAGGYMPGEVAVFLGEGNGSFQAAVEYTIGNDAVGVTLADFNGDGNLDIATASYFDPWESILLGNGDGTFGTPMNFGAGEGPGPNIAADFNGDGKMDLANTTFGSTQGNVAVLLGNGDGTLQARGDYLTAAVPISVALGDFTGNGIADIVTADGGSKGSDNVSVLLNNGHGALGPHTEFEVGGLPASAAVGDFNGDGNSDVVTANPGANTVSLLLGNGNGTFQTHVDFDTGIGPVAVVTGDFNGDGKLDVATADAGQGTVSILLGNGNGTFQNHVEYLAGSGPIAMIAADLNGDGKLDLAVVNEGVNTVSVLFGNGDGSFQAPASYPIDYGSYSIAVADFNGDGKPDLAVATECGTDPLCEGGFGGVSILLNNGNGTFQPQVFYAVGGIFNVAVGDFNGDGIADIACIGGLGFYVLLGNGNGTFQLPAPYDVGTSPVALVVGDVMGGGGGMADVVTANCGTCNQSTSNTVSVLINLAGTETALSSSPNPSDLNQAVTFTATVTANMQSLGVPTGSVQFLNGGATFGTATVNSSGVAAFTSSTLPAGMNSITAEYLGDSTFGGSTSAAVAQNVVAPNPNFTLASNPTSLNVPPGGSGQATLTVTPQNGFNQAVTFSCAGLPAKATCTFNPETVTPSGGAATTTLTIQTAAASLLVGEHRGEPNSPLPMTLLLVGFAAIAGIGLIGLRFAPDKHLRWAMCALIILLAGIGLSSCGGGSSSGGGGSSGTPTGTYTVMVTATTGGSNALTQTTPITLTVN